MQRKKEYIDQISNHIRKQIQAKFLIKRYN